MGGQRAVQLVELFAAGSGDGDGHAQVFVALAGPKLNGAGIKAGVKAASNVGDGGNQAVGLDAHHFDWELAGVGDERFSGAGRRRVGWWIVRGGVHIDAAVTWIEVLVSTYNCWLIREAQPVK